MTKICWYRRAHLNHLSVQLILIFFGVILFGHDIPLLIKQFFLAMSQTLQRILIFFLPLIIFSCLFKSLTAYQDKAFRFVLSLLGLVCVSNLLAILVAYGAGKIGFSYLAALSQAPVPTVELTPLWSFSLPSMLSNHHALLAGVFLGLIVSVGRWKTITHWGHALNRSIMHILARTFVPLLPLFALGFILKMDHEGLLVRAVTLFAPVLVIAILTCVSYVVILYAIAASFKVSRGLCYLRNMFPACLLAFSTMSSFAAMPVTLSASEKNTQNEHLVRAVIPATVNIHMVGGSLVIPMIAIFVGLMFMRSMPTFSEYWVFTEQFMITKFSVAAVPSGSMMVMMPVFKSCFGFTEEMCTLMLAVYVLFDPLITATNVLGNGAFAIIFSKLFKKGEVHEIL
jgi:Na+/H+-dicarboxylate symporter